MRGIGKYFKTLTIEKKDILVKNGGTFIARRFSGKQKIELYSVNIIFVEIFYGGSKGEVIKIEEINFENLEKHYLKHVNII